MTASTAPSIDLLRLAFVRRVIASRWFPRAFQVASLAMFLAFLVLGWMQFAPADVPGKLYAKSSLVNLVIWGLWWPAMVWAAVLFGRIWCSICPLELVADRGERLGRRLGIRQRKLAGWLRAGWLIVALYAVVQLLVAGFGLHRVPAYTAFFLLAMLGMAAVAGFFLQSRAYCRGFCPVGLLLGTYGRGSMLAVRANHEHLATTNPADSAHIAQRCPSLLNPLKLSSSKDCLVCGECIRASDHEEMGLLLRAPFHASNARQALASWPVTIFVILVSGFVTYELTTNWAAGKKVFLWAPSQVAPALGLEAGNGWVGGVWKLVVFPLLLWLALGGLTVAARGASSLGEAWRRLALPVVVVVAAGHMAKGLEKMATWGGYLPQSLGDPTGIDSSRAYVAGTLAAPAHLLSKGMLSAAGVGLLALALAFGLRELRLAEPRAVGRRAPSLILVWGFFSVIVARWGLWP